MHMHMHMNMHMHIDMHMHMHIYIHICIYIHIYVRQACARDIRATARLWPGISPRVGDSPPGHRDPPGSS